MNSHCSVPPNEDGTKFKSIMTQFNINGTHFEIETCF